jgi:2-octaprenyl-6-methoxyphenol hydroxylase
MNLASDETYDVVVAGGGPVGLSAAAALHLLGCSVAITGLSVESAPAALDPRTFALFQPALRFLENLGVGAFSNKLAAPLEAIRLIDDTGRLMRAPDTLFEARDLGLDAFGVNIPHTALVTALMGRLMKTLPPGSLIQSPVASLVLSPEAVQVHLESGRVLAARLLVAADGRQSVCRTLARRPTRRWSYPQSALVTSIAHSRPHQNVSTELHRPAGPLTTVPLPGQSSSIVWVERPNEAERLSRLDDGDFARELHARLQGFLGRIEAVGPRRIFPLEGLVAEPAGEHRAALVGEALHAFPPIGAQGLNLGFRDVASLVDALTDARTRDPGAGAVLATYSQSRRRDVHASLLMVDTLDRTLFSGFLPLQLARGAGLHLANAIPRLKQALMQRGMGVTPDLPRLMRDAPWVRAAAASEPG